MTDTNNKETFESKLLNMMKPNKNNSMCDFVELKQLHDKSISKSRLTIICLNSRIEQLLKNLNQKDKEIKELQAEVKNVRENFTFQLNNNHKNDDIIYKLKKEIKHQEFLISEYKKHTEFKRSKDIYYQNHAMNVKKD